MRTVYIIIFWILTLTSIAEAANLIVSSSTTLCGVQNYEMVVINNSAKVTICAYTGTGTNGTLTFNTTNFTLASGSVITGNISGFTATLGPGHGSSGSWAGGGGGYGGIGGSNGAGEGIAYGSTTNVSSMGSGGGSSDATGGKGGGFLNITSTNIANINGTITMNGENGVTGNGGSGGGSGGGINIYANTVIGSGKLYANGGQGGDCTSYGGGGGGAGGRILISYSTSTTALTTSVTGGNGGWSPDAYDGSPGAAGTATTLDYTPILQTVFVVLNSTNVPLFQVFNNGTVNVRQSCTYGGTCNLGDTYCRNSGANWRDRTTILGFGDTKNYNVTNVTNYKNPMMLINQTGTLWVYGNINQSMGTTISNYCSTPSLIITNSSNATMACIELNTGNFYARGQITCRNMVAGTDLTTYNCFGNAACYSQTTPLTCRATLGCEWGGIE